MVTTPSVTCSSGTTPTGTPGTLVHEIIHAAAAADAWSYSETLLVIHASSSTTTDLNTGAVTTEERSGHLCVTFTAEKGLAAEPVVAAGVSWTLTVVAADKHTKGFGISDTETIDGGSITSNLSSTLVEESSVDLSVASKPLTASAASPTLLAFGTPSAASRDVTSEATLKTMRSGNVSGDWLGAASGGDLAAGNGFQFDTSGEFLMTRNNESTFKWNLLEQTLSDDYVFLDGTNGLKLDGSTSGSVDGELKYESAEKEGSYDAGGAGLIAKITFGWKVGSSVDAGHKLHVDGQVSSQADLTVEEVVTDSGLRVWADSNENANDWLNIDIKRREHLVDPANPHRTGVLEGRLLREAESTTEGGVDVELLVEHGHDHASGHANLDLEESGDDLLVLKIVYQETHLYSDANTFFRDVGTSFIGIKANFSYEVQLHPRVTLANDGTSDVSGTMSIRVDDVIDVRAGIVSNGYLNFDETTVGQTSGLGEHFLMVEAHADYHYDTTRTFAPGATVGLPSVPTKNAWITIEIKERDEWFDPTPFVMWEHKSKTKITPNSTTVTTQNPQGTGSNPTGTWHTRHGRHPADGLL